MTSSIALVGMACRYPDARSPSELWESVLSQRRAFRRLPAERLRLQDYLSEPGDDGDTFYATQVAVLEGFEFNRARFRVPGRTFRAVDMAHWLALEVAADALAHAGFPDGEGLPRESTGVLVGNSLTGEFSRANLARLRWPYVRRVVEAALEARSWSVEKRSEFLAQLEEEYKSPFPESGDESLAGALSNTIAGRICNHFDFQGGGYTIDGACASSLLAVATACSALVAEDLDLAVAGGVDLSLDPFELVGFSKLGALAAEEMRVYDARSAGFWPGEGCGFVVLMRREDALRQKVPIHALLRGWGISSDGSGGITRPEIQGQQLALRRAYRRAGFGIETVPYFEGHGTGTAVGDPTELRALSRLIRERSPSGEPAVIGSVKANIGHTKAAAGVAGLIKATMAVQSQLLPPCTAWEQPNPALAEEGNVLRLIGRGELWPADRPLRAGVSAMGFGGINAHVVIESEVSGRRKTIDSPTRVFLSSPQDAELFLFRARNAVDLRRQLDRVRTYAARLSRAELIDLAAALAEHIEQGETRGAVVASNAEQLEANLEVLDSWLADGVQQRLDIRGGVMLGTGTQRPTVGFLFPGQGSPANLRGGAWFRRFPAIYDLYCQANLPRDCDAVATQIAQPAIVTGSMAGLKILERLGIQAATAVGTSLGELSAYHWAGAISGASLLRIATARGQAVADFGSPDGAMASVAAGSAAVGELLDGDAVVIAGLNSPMQTVVSGEAGAVDELITRARAAGLTAVRLRVSHAFHSPLVAASTPALAEVIDAEQFRPLQQPVASTISGRMLKPEQDLRALLLEQMTSPVRFIQALDAAADSVDLWIEVGPGSVMRGIASSMIESPVVSLDVCGKSLRSLLDGVAVAFALGVPVNCSTLWDDRFARSFDLDWQPRFLANPCERAPSPLVTAPPVEAGPAKTAAATSLRTRTAELADATPLEAVQQLVADIADLPVSAVNPDDRLLNDFHFSSLMVGQLVAEAARTLGAPPPVSPTDAANASVGEIAELLEQLVQTPSRAEDIQDKFPPGVDSWVRAFTVQLVEHRPPARRPEVGTGPWRVVCPEDYLQKDALTQAFSGGDGGPGVVVALPPEPDERHIDLLLTAAQAALAGSPEGRFVMVQHGGGGAAFTRSLKAELPDLTTCVVDVPLHHRQAVDWIVAESRAATGHTEVHYDRTGTRREPRLRLLSLPTEVPPIPLDSDDVMLVTGGGKGIASLCASFLAEQTGVRLALIGRSDPAEDEQLKSNLRRLAEMEAQVKYCRADVTDALAVQAAVQQVQRSFGPITAVIHAAGCNVPQKLSSLTREAFLQTVRPKVDGVRNVLAAIDPAQLRLLVTFGSIIARTGMRGQTDYAVANEWLTRLTERWQREHPDCHCVAMEWSVWTGVGMGERLGAIGALQQQGISPIRPDDGVRVLAHLAGETLPGVAVVVSGRFGTPPTVKFESNDLPLLRFLERPSVHVPGVELVVDADLSEDADPYLRDHILSEVPLLPAVMGIEAMAQAAMAVTDSQDWPDFQDVTFQQPIVVAGAGPVSIRVAALVRQRGVVDVAVRSEETGFQVDHFRATCCFKPSSSPPTQSSAPLTDAADEPPAAPLDARRDLYGGILFHTGRFRRVAGYRRLSATGCVAEITSGGKAAWFGQYLPDRLVLGDAAARDAAIHAIQACIPRGTLLPIGIDRLVIDRLAEGPTFVRAVERSRDPDTFVYDVQVTEEDGSVLEKWEGLQLRRVSESTETGLWPEVLLGPYMERRLGELLPGVKASIAVERKDGSDRTMCSDRVIQRAAGVSNRVYRHTGGKPQVSCGRHVSAAHAESLTLAVADECPVACDVQAVVRQSEEMWRDLLTPERLRLAEFVADCAEEDRDNAATRVWAAAECLKKMGKSFDTPLIFDSRTEDNWVVLTAGAMHVATWVGEVRDVEQNLVFAFSVPLL